MLAAVRWARHDDLAILLLHSEVALDALGQLATRALHAHQLRLDLHGHAGGHGNRLSTDTRHPYQTFATSSPPTPARRASCPVITPLDVDTMVVPIPPWTLGI